MALIVALIIVIIVAATYVTFPNLTETVTKKLNSALGNPETEALSNLQTQAKFVNLDGKVQVKRVNSSSSWDCP